MEQQNITAVIYYDRPGESDAMHKILEYWHTLANKSGALGSSIFFTITTQETRELDSKFHQIRLNVAGLPIRPNSIMDVKEWLSICAFDILSEQYPEYNILICDADALFRKDPWFYFSGWKLKDPCAFGLGIDCGNRSVADGVLERNAGVIFFPRFRARERIIAMFRNCWGSLAPIKCPVFLLGQRVWSLTHFKLNGAIFQREMNWSHKWSSYHDMFIHHFHGPAGKEKLNKEIESCNHQPFRF